MFLDPGVPQCDSFAKYAVDYLDITLQIGPPQLLAKTPILLAELLERGIFTALFGRWSVL